MIAVPAGGKTNLVAAYVAEKTGCDFQPGMFTAMAILDDDGNFCAGVVFHEFRGHDVQMSTATETSIAWQDHVLRAIFQYVFVQLGCVRATAATKKANKRCREFLTHLGFRLEGRMRLGYDGVKDALVYGLLRDECIYVLPAPTQEDAVNGLEVAVEPVEPGAAAGLPAPAEKALAGVDPDWF